MTEDMQSLIAIDTCVFEQLMNPVLNVNNHITAFLLACYKIQLRCVVDEKGEIVKEYKRRLDPHMRRYEVGTECVILRAMLADDQLARCCDEPSPSLRKAVEGIIVEKKEKVDRLFVYVAGYTQSNLVTNDRHILGKGGVNRRQLLVKALRKSNLKRTSILSTQEAHSCYASELSQPT